MRSEKRARNIRRPVIIGAIILGLLIALGFQHKAGRSGSSFVPVTGDSTLINESWSLINRFGPLLNKSLKDSFVEVQQERLFWYAVILLGILPTAGLVGFLVFPLLMRGSIRERLPDVNWSRLYRLYLVEGLLAFLLLLVLGSSVWFVQFWTNYLGRGENNPQVVLQEEEVNYVLKHGFDLTRRYPEVFVPLGRELSNHPQEAIIPLIIKGGLQERSDPLMEINEKLVNFTWPTFSFFFLVTFGLLLVFFLQRVWPDVKIMLRHPVDTLVSTRRDGVQLGMAAVGRLMLVEIKVTLVFALVSIFLSGMSAVFLNIFFKQVIGPIIEISAAGMVYIIRLDGPPLVMLAGTLIMLVFLLESVILFMLSFAFMTGKITDVLRARFKGQLEHKQTRQLNRQVVAQFARVAGTAIGLSVGLSAISSFLIKSSEKSGDPNWLVLLIGVPVVLLLGLNLGMWLTRGFKALDHLWHFNIPTTEPVIAEQSVLLVR